MPLVVPTLTAAALNALIIWSVLRLLRTIRADPQQRAVALTTLALATICVMLAVAQIWC